MKMRNLFLCICIVLLITGCSPKSEEELFYESQRMLNKIESYQCDVEITSIGNKGQQKYMMRQWFKKPDKYRLEVMYPDNLKGKITIFDGKKAWMYHPAIEQTWIMDGFFNSQEQNLFLGYFIENYVNSETAQIQRKKIDNAEYLVIVTEIPGNHAYFSKEWLWMDIETKKPILLQIFDRQDDLRIEVKYTEFEYNPEIEDDLFTLTNKQNLDK